MTIYNKCRKYTSVLTFLTIALALCQFNAFAGGGGSKNGNKESSKTMQQKNLWRQVKPENLENVSESQRLPEKYLVFRLNQSSLKDSLKNLPLQDSDAARVNPLIMQIPMPDGSIQRFRMEETDVISPENAASLPDWKTFTGYGIDNPQAVGQFDWTVLGFHGYILTGKDTVVIDPYQRGDTENYLVYNKSEYGKPADEFFCSVEDKMKKTIETDHESDFAPTVPKFTFGGSVRTYRLAIATTGEWSRNAAGADPTNPTQTPLQIRQAAYAVVITTINRLNGIYTRELASRFQNVNPNLDNNQTNIIFDNPNTDPYLNEDTTAELTKNQTTLDNRVGTNNYDIGHLYGTGGGGVATSPSLCDNADKAQGYSARDTTLGDPFTVDYVAHEIGHQFGASHTYNNIDTPGTGSCPQSSYSAANAFEPGSGSTIMSYVGICGARNLQQFNDFNSPMFHIRSLTQINTYVSTGTPSQTACGTASGTNNVPTVDAGVAYTIPRLTPFTLTATGTDADSGDVNNLLYSWEEYDVAQAPSGPMGTPAGTFDVDNDGILRPLFRVYSPVAINTRTFPSLTFILNPANNDQSANVNGVAGNQPVLTYTGTHPTGKPGAVCETGMTCPIGERLPTVSRTMNYRVSLRDRRGGVVDAGTTVTIAGGAGPFQVTTQNSAAAANTRESLLPSAPAATWQAGTRQTVTWDVAGTGAGTTVNAANVNILLSTNGGQTFPVTIIANTPNDGTEEITVPNNTTSTARIKVEAVGNIFFDINNANFAITAPTAAAVSISGRVMSSRGRGVSNAIVISTDQSGVVQTARTNQFGYYRFNGILAGETYVLDVRHKRYIFSPQVVSVNDELTSLNFIARN